MGVTDRSERARHFATLFETITGQSTLTERQRNDVPVRYDEREEATQVSEYVGSAVAAQGFDDVIEDPESY